MIHPVRRNPHAASLRLGQHRHKAVPAKRKDARADRRASRKVLKKEV